MKYTFLLIIFNIVLFISFLLIFLLPFTLFGADFFSGLWKQNIFFAGIFLCLCAPVNIVFAVNARLFSALEREDWPSLVLILEKKISKKNKISGYYVTLLCNACILSSNFAALNRLEELLKVRSRRLFSENLIRFASVAVLQNNFAHARELLKETPSVNGNLQDWCIWYEGLILYLEKDFTAAAPVFGTLLTTCSDCVVAALCAFLLDNRLFYVPDAACEPYMDAVVLRKTELRKKFSAEKWKKIIGREKGEIYGIAIASLLDETSVWLYEKKESTG